MMKIVLAIALLLIVAPTVRGDDDDDDDRRSPADRVSLYTGVFELGFTLEGELGDCDPPPPGSVPRLLFRSTYGKLAGVCDDQGDRPCAGRLIRLTERCTADDVVYPIDSARRVEYVKHRLRICFDETGDGNCDDVDEVASGVVFFHVTGGFWNNLTDDDPGTFDESGISYDREVIKKSKRFRIDGKRVRVPRGHSNGQGAFRFDNTCIFETNACPITGSLVRE